MRDNEGIEVSHFVKVDPRKAWQSEPADFTPWLAQEENFAALASELHLVDAEVIRVEQPIGDFSADIVGRDRDGAILVENQIAQTDHSHLGQIMTYLAGLPDDSAKVVWISTRVRDEHRAAIDWLNENTGAKYSFFAIELELIRIGESPYAPLFHVISKPNSWSRHVSARARAIEEGEYSERQQQYRRLWSEIAKHFDEMEPNFRGSAPPRDHWWQFPTGRTGFSTTLTAGGRDHNIGVEFYIHNDEDKEFFEFFESHRAEINDQLGSDVEWERLEGKKGSRIVRRKHGLDPFDPNNLSELKTFYWSNLQEFRSTFLPLLRQLP